MFNLKSSKTFSFTSHQTINSFKTMLACLLGMLLVQFLGFPSLAQWVMISIVVVMSAQVNLGGVVKKSYVRIIGTISGALIAGISILLFSQHPAILWTVLILSCAFFTYIDSSPENTVGAGTLGSVTVIIILLKSPLSLSVVILRPVEIVMGILIALLVTRFVFPIRATENLKANLAETLKSLKELWLIESDHLDYDELPEAKKIDEKVLAQFIKQRALLKDAKAEGHYQIKKSALSELMAQERKFYRAILLAHYTLQNDKISATLIEQLPIYQTSRKDIAHQLDSLITNLNDKAHLPLTPVPKISLESLSKSLKTISMQQVFDHALYIDAFIVAMQLLVDELNLLSQIIARLYSHRASSAG